MGGSNFEVKIHPGNCQKCCEKNGIPFLRYKKTIKSGSAPFIFGFQLISPLPIGHVQEHPQELQWNSGSPVELQWNHTLPWGF
jgi:hypothetical protein